MSDIAKWGLLIAGAVVIIGLIIALPFMNFVDTGQLTSAINDVVSVASSAFTSVRGLLNNFLSPFGRTALSGLIVYFFTKWIVTATIKLTTWIYHFIFK